MELQRRGPVQPHAAGPAYSDDRLDALAYAMGVLGDPRELVGAEGSLADLLEVNSIPFREVRTPADLLTSTRALLLVLDAQDGRPLVVHRRMGRPVLFDPKGGGGLQPLEPSQAFKPYAFELYATLPPGLRSLLPLLSFSLAGQFTPLLAVLFSALVVALFNLSIPTLTAYLVGTVLPIGQQRLLVETSLVVMLVACSTVVAQTFSSLALVRLESLLNLRLESALWIHLLRLPLAFFSQLGTADLITRVGAIRQMRQLLSNGLLSAGLALLFSVSNLVLMVVYQAQLALVAGLFSLGSALVMALLVWRNARLERPLQEGQARVSDLGLQAVAGMAQVRVGGNEPFVFEQWFRAMAGLATLQRRGEGYANALEILARVLNPLGQALIFGVFVVILSQAKATPAAGPQVEPGGLAGMGANQLVAAFVSFQAAYLAFNSQMSALATQVASTVARLVVLWQRSTVVMFATPEPGAGQGGRQHAVQGQFALQNLQVRYPGASEPLLREISLEIPAGTYTAITGPSGCGKTTLLRCLLRLMEPEAGVISVDGLDLRQLLVRAYRRQLGVVLQNTPLPSGSIYEIVRAGRAYSREEVWEALAQAAIADDVRRMGMQLETVISEGAGAISGGQRQRLALARALLGQPRVLLLDEATSALDAPTQAVVTHTLESLPITRIAIAHRLSTIQSADQIAVIQNGTIAELGTYDELARRSGGYLARHPSSA
jgi:ATP-binding cassette subfamily B protein